MSLSLTLYHLFPNYMNLYGDRGNVLAFQKRCEWRGIKVDVQEITNTNHLSLSQADILFMGGGSDREQYLAAKELISIKDELKSAMEDDVSILTICGGYQFFGQYYKKLNGEVIKGLGLLDFYTEAKPKRLVGNIHIYSNQFDDVIGFENHGGHTYHAYEPLGTVVSGFGNNGLDQTEGLIYKHTIGSYLHGPILPKNPQITDWLISSALERKYGIKQLTPLNDALELATKKSVFELYL